MRIRFDSSSHIHQEELEKHFDIKSTKDNIKQGEANLNPANLAFKAIEEIEESEEPRWRNSLLRLI